MRRTLFLLLILLTLVSCASFRRQETLSEKTPEPELKASQGVKAPEEESSTYRENTEEDLRFDPNDPSTYVVVAGEMIPWNSTWQMAVEPDSALDIFSMGFEDFGTFFEESYPVEVTSYLLAEGTAAQTTVWHIHSENEGPTIYISGGIHGNERAAWYAGVLLRNATISCGDLYVLSQANVIGARKVSRGLESNMDPNRYFPGDPSGSLTEQLDWAIYTDIQDKSPDLVLDLHEAILVSSSRDFLGSTYIFTSLEGTDFLLFDMLEATETGEICHNEFTATGPGPNGSLNSTVANSLGIPVITVETFRGFDVYRRVYDQLDTVQYVLEYYGMRGENGPESKAVLY